MRNALVALILFALQGSYAILAVAANNGIPANPWIADSPYAISHHDPAQTDVTPVDGPTIGGRIRYDQAQTVPVVWCSAPIYKRVGE